MVTGINTLAKVRSSSDGSGVTNGTTPGFLQRCFPASLRNKTPWETRIYLFGLCDLFMICRKTDLPRPSSPMARTVGAVTPGSLGKISITIRAQTSHRRCLIGSSWNLNTIRVAEGDRAVGFNFPYMTSRRKHWIAVALMRRSMTMRRCQVMLLFFAWNVSSSLPLMKRSASNERKGSSSSFYTWSRALSSIQRPSWWRTIGLNEKQARATFPKAIATMKDSITFKTSTYQIDPHSDPSLSFDILWRTYAKENRLAPRLACCISSLEWDLLLSAGFRQSRHRCWMSYFFQTNSC